MCDNTMGLCPMHENCGGCIHQGIPYEEQVASKDRQVRKLLINHNVDIDVYQGMTPAFTPYRYRNKMEYTFGDFVKDGEMTLGMHRKKNFMSIVTVDNCQLVDPDFNIILKAVLDFSVEKGYTFYHKRSHSGLLRNLIIRKGIRTGELLVNIVTTSEEGFDEDKFTKMLLSLTLDNEIVGVLRTYCDSLADAVVPDSLKTLYGRDYYMEKLLGLDFKVSAFSFFQTNVEAAERLYTEALALVDSFEGKIAFDLYCGTGTISQVLALKAKEVLGIELVEEAVDAATENAAMNDLDNCRFIAGDVFKVLSEISDKPDVIVVDPPRVGIHPKALDKIISYGVKEIVYISCNPKTLAENLRYLDYYGYKCKYLKPFDNFPMTKHVECVVLMSKVKG